MLSPWNSEATTAVTLHGIEFWTAARLAPMVQTLPGADDRGWHSAHSWDAPPPVFVRSVADQDDPVFAQLDELLSLPDNWNGYDGRAPSADAVAQAKEFYGLLSSDGPTPAIEPSGDGEINLVWRGPNRYLELGLYGDGALSYYGKIDGAEILGDLATVPAILPKELRIALATMGDGRV